MSGEIFAADRYDAEVAMLVQSFEFELCDKCGGDGDVHTLVKDPLGHAHMLCPSTQDDGDDELSPDAVRCPQPLLLDSDAHASGTDVDDTVLNH